MKRYCSIILVLLCLPALAADKVDKTLDATADGIVEIDNVRGDIKITGWDKNQVKVTGTLDALTEEFIFTQSGDRTIIKVKLPRNSRHHNRAGSKLKIFMPLQSKVNFNGVATDLTVKQILGGLEINSVSGNMDILEVKGRTYINSVSGKLKLRDVAGSIEVSTVSGDLDAVVDCKKINVSGVSADLKIKLKQVESVRLSNVSGDTAIYGALMSDGEMKLGSVSGNAYFYVDGQLDARIMVETAPGGEIVNEYSNDRPSTSFINSHNLKFTAGEGSGVIRMSTVSGNIGLKNP